ncbi:hypothetical protein L596_009522 [Steinernema carpocapsae]|uniref:EGF-like domain-containing protein n=1 Tax=Steinernema carpocapsae TaxID=34508 RepID=A0A4U5PGD6_STECR|nr:hypothetical protein L596_009522 [Steinernema carpocapsae]
MLECVLIRWNNSCFHAQRPSGVRHGSTKPDYYCLLYREGTRDDLHRPVTHLLPPARGFSAHFLNATRGVSNISNRNLKFSSPCRTAAHAMLLRLLPLAALLLGSYASECDILSESTVMKCSSLIMEYANPEVLHPPLSEIGQICEKYVEFKKCTHKVSESCRKSVIPQVSGMFDRICTMNFAEKVMLERECFLRAEIEDSMKECLQNKAALGAFGADMAEMDIEMLLTSSDHACNLIERYAGCYTQDVYLRYCKNAASLEYSILFYLAEEHNSTLSACGLRPFEKVVEKFLAVEKERAIGGCDTEGNCHCIEGYEINNATKKCVDVNECERGTHRCSQQCFNTIGSYLCECDQIAHKLGADNRTCERIDQTPYVLFFAHGQNIWNISADGQHFDLQRAGLQKTAMIDLDVKEKKIYYADIGTNVIERVDINGAIPQQIQTYEVDGVEGIAVDWIARNLYSIRKENIFVQTLDGLYRKTLYKNVFKLPRALVAHSGIGRLFASDWSSSAFIASIATDGSEFQKIITESIVWPNALTVDVYTNKLYWADAFLDTIQSCNFDGSDRRAVVSDPSSVPHVFGLAVIDDFLYWTDWTYRGILRADKHTGRNVTVLAQTALLPYSIKILHSSVQPVAENPCVKKGCQQLCLLAKSGSEAKCACSDGFNLNKDHKTCKSNCSKDHIVCGGSDPRCISKKYLCDGIMQCKDGKDEKECPPRICSPGQFQCHDTKKCLKHEELCDGKKQCGDGSDEKYCHVR